MKIAIVKYNAGNTQSVIYALNRLGIEPLLSDDKEVLMSADKVIFPGVGEASTAMKFLKEKELDIVLKNLSQPVLGICLGLQLMCLHSEENNTKGLGLIPIHVKRFPATDKVPHMGWNSMSDFKGPLLKGVQENDFVYFVHSYYAEPSEYSVATCNYICPFGAALQKDNFFAVQFHTEKSGLVGEKILRNFIEI